MKRSIKTKLMSIMLVILIIPIALISAVSYRSSSKMMTDEYRQLGQTIGSQITNGIELKMENLESSIDVLSATEIITSEAEDVEKEKIIGDKLLDLVNTHKLGRAYFIDMNGSTVVRGVESVDLKTSESWYTDSILPDNKDRILWSDIRNEENGSLYITMSKGVYVNNAIIGVLGMDIPIEVFDNILSPIRIGETGFPILIDGNATKVALKDTHEIGTQFKGKERFENMEGTSAAIRNIYTNAEGVKQDQFMIANKVKNTDWYIVTIVPINDIKVKTGEMLRTIIIIGIITVVAGMALAITFSRTITTTISKILINLKKMEGGDLTGRFELKSSDEFGEFRDRFNNMKENISHLISHIKDACSDINTSFESLASISTETSAAGEEIATTAAEIASGANDQAQETYKSAELMLKLSERLDELNNSSGEVLNLIEDANLSLENSNVVMEEINRNTEKNLQGRLKVSEKINSLDGKIGQVGSILSTIDEIAEQTNLLALNASIEAARAGEAGKGFAVVADEIRKLAGESKESSSNIKTIIEDVQRESKETVEVMGDVRKSNEEQVETSKKINETFKSLRDIILKISSKIEEVGVHVVNISKDKDDVVSSIENISSVSEETAAASEEVSASIEQQTYATNEIADATEKLSRLSQKLNEEIAKFKI